jgi:ribose transport system ATP-binding protein
MIESNDVAPLWEVRDLVKRYPGVVANDRVSLAILPGQIHGLLGENGCGKSTLIKILSGVEQPSSGEILKDGRPIRLGSPVEARRAGIATVFQEFSLVPDLSVAENIFLGRAFTTRIGLLDRSRIQGESVRILDLLGLGGEVDPRATVRALSVAQQQLVEIAKAISVNARTLILDEPTAALSLPEIERLHALLRRLKAQGQGILYVSHRLDEVVALIDVATILKDGQRVRAPGEIEIAIEPIISAMIGGDLKQHFPPRRQPSTKILFEMEQLGHDGGQEVSFSLRAGEILGIAGVMGSGRTSLLRTFFGLNPSAACRMRLRGESYAPPSPLEAIRLGVAFIAENRKSDGLFFNFSGAENTTIAALEKITRHGMLNFSAERDSFKGLLRGLSINPRAAKVKVGDLSGGNQQKIVLARWIFGESELFLLDEPTQGIDVGARESIYQLLWDLTRQGKAIILVSSDLEELLGLSDRIAILRNSIMTEIRPASTYDEHSLSVAIAGSTRAQGTSIDQRTVSH